MALVDTGEAGLTDPDRGPDPASTADPGLVPGRLGRAAGTLWRLPLRWHAAALAVILLGLLTVMSPGSAYTSDDGAYALQAQSLEDGSWAYDYRAAPFDPERTNFPVILSDRSGDSFFAYVSHPVYPIMVVAARRLAGPVFGMHLLPLLGALAAAAAAWLVASQLDPKASRPAFWLVAASPVVANGYMYWAHSLSAALAGLAMAAAIRIHRRGATPLLVGGLAVALAAGALLRSEAVLLALVVALVVAVGQVRRVGIVRSAAILGALAGPTALAVLGERRWTVSIVGVATRNLELREGPTSSYLGGRISGAWHVLFNGNYDQASATLPVLLAMALVLGLGFLALRRWRAESRRDLSLVAVTVVGVVAARMVLFPHESVTGLFAAWPLALLGLFLLPRRERGSGRGPVLAIMAGFLAAVLMTQYPEGGGLEWGGRFLSPVVVPLAVLAVIGFRHRLAGVPPPDRRWAAGCLVVVAAATGVLGISTVAQGRARHERMIAAVRRHPAPVTITTIPGLPRVAWRTHEQLTWMLTDKAGLAPLLQRLGEQGLSEVTVVSGRSADDSGWPAGWSGREIDEPGLGDAGIGLFLLRR